MPTEDAAVQVGQLHVIEFDYRSDDGPLLVGPFTSEQAAREHMDTLTGPEFEAEYSIVSLAAVAEAAEAAEDDEMPVDELEEGEEEITEIPVHGVAVVEGLATGDGRGFRLNALDLGAMPQPLGYEYTSTHGGDTSNVAIVGRIDEYERKEIGEGQAELRWRGVILTSKEYAGQAIDSIVDGSYTGLSVIVDSVEVDVDEQKAEMVKRMAAGEEDKPLDEMSEAELRKFVDEMVGDGKIKTTWFTAARVRRFDMVPTGAFQEAYIALGHEFDDELTPEAIEAAALALESCGCADSLPVVDLTELSPEDVEAYDAMSVDEQFEYALEHGLVASAFAPGTKDGPGWITHPTATARIRRYWVRGKGAAKIRWGVPGDFNRCRMQLAKYVQNPDWLAGLCANMHKEAIGVWPGQEKGGRHALVASAPAPLFSMVAAAKVEPVDAALFANPKFSQAEGIKIEGERITGYIAVWNVCHIGNPEGPGRCTLAPRSATNYAWFRTGNVMTTEGMIPVGQITMSTGHAGPFLSAAEAVSHYDNTGTVIADVACGEDPYGIWFSGRVRPGVDPDLLFAAMASGRISGDWRKLGGNYELVAGLVVNVAGYPMPNPALVASGSGATAIIGEGIFEPLAPAVTASGSEVIITSELLADVATLAVEKYVETQRRNDIVERVSPVRASIQKQALAHARRGLAQLTKVE
jgi:hypothetical protein